MNVPAATSRGWPAPAQYCCLLALSVIFLPGCRKQPANTIPPRYAVLRFENLSGDPSLDWVGRAVSESLPVALAETLDGPVLESAALGRLAAVLGGRPVAAPGDSTERATAIAAGANHAISGYVERKLVGNGAGTIRITATDEDLSTGRRSRTVTGSGASPLAAMQSLARQFSPNSHPGPTANEAAIRAYAIGFEAAAPTKRENLEAAIQLDRNFGRAWVALAAFEVSAGDRARAEQVMEDARRQKIDERSRADIDFGEAGLKGDRAALVPALRRLVNLSPGDAILLRNLAETETNIGDFKSAAADWKRVTVTAPNDAVAWNGLGYVQSYAGDYAGALASLREYQRLRPKEANPHDSMGDLNFSFGKYAAAADNYLEASKRQPGFEQFADLYKAAWAKFRAGDKTNADKLFAEFRTQRGKSPDPLLPLLEGDWLYRTGRQQEAVAALRQMPNGPSHASAFAQLVVWDLLAGDRDQAARDSAAIGPATTAPVFMARFMALASAPASEWKARAEKAIPPAAAALRITAVGYALLLDQQKQAALPIWADIVKSTTATDFFSRAIYLRLQGKPIDRPLIPDPGALNQFAALLEKL